MVKEAGQGQIERRVGAAPAADGGKRTLEQGSRTVRSWPPHTLRRGEIQRRAQDQVVQSGDHRHDVRNREAGLDQHLHGLFVVRQHLAYAQLRRHAGTDITPVCPERALTPLIALEGYTTHAAIAAGEADRAGRIARSLRADLTAFALDPLTTPSDELAQTPVPLTMSNGRISYRV